MSEKKAVADYGLPERLPTGKGRLPGFDGGWVEKPIGKIMRIRKERINPKAVDNVRCIELEHVEPISGRLLKWIESKNQKSLKAVFTAGDVLFGKLRPYLKKFHRPAFNGLCSTEFWVLTAIDDSISNNYIYYIVQTDRFLEIANSTTGTKMPRAEWHLVMGIAFPLPPLPEQRAIAEALTDVDSLVESLEKLIAKKKAIKQGAMQELLTGKRRLPGFDGEWVEQPIKYYGAFTSGNGFPLKYQGKKGGIFPFFKVSDFSNMGNEYLLSWANNYIRQSIAKELNCNIIPCRSIIFAKIGAAIFLERKRQNAHDCCIDNNMMAFTVNEEGDSKYLLYLFQTIKFGNIVTATALPSLSGKQVGTITKKFPPTKSEQHAIATVLSDMDRELESLSAKLEKAKLIKLGMMDDLLTGRIRLIKYGEDYDHDSPHQMVAEAPIRYSNHNEAPKHG